MSRSDEYRANAAECQKMARIAKNPGEKATWLAMAEDWLRMIPPPLRSAAEKFATSQQSLGTGRENSERPSVRAEH